MADILLTLHRENEGFEAYKRALDPNLDRRLTRRERDRLKGMYAIDSWDFPTAIEAFRDYQTYYPNDPLGWVYPTYPLRMLGRDTEAIENLKRAAKLSPKSANSLTDLAAEDIVVGNLDVAKALIGRANQIEPTGHAVELSASIAFLQGDYSKARDLITSLGNAANSRERSRSFEMLANLDAEQGDYQAAIEALNKGIQDDIAQGNPSAQSAKLSGRAWMDAKTGQFEQCSNDLKVAQTLDPSPETTLTVETVLGQAIDLAPRPVKIKLRRQMIEISVNLPGVDFGQISSILKLRTTGEALLAGGRSMAALGQFWQLSAIEAPSGVREYLGRALSTAASQEPDRKKAKEMELEATEAYAKAALHPERIWLYSYNYPPGFYADQLEVYLQLANEAGDSSPAILEAQQRLKNLRSEQQFVR
jgi:tetratricopeptide (TPR) repeat protein